MNINAYMTLGIAIIGGILSFANVKFQASALEERVKDIEISIQKSAAAQSTIESVLATIQNDIKWIKDTLTARRRDDK